MKNKNFLKKLAAVTLGFVMTLGVGAAGYSASVYAVRAEKITDSTKIVAGDYYIGATTGGSDYYLSATATGKGTAVSKENATLYTFASSGTGWTIQVKSSGNYLTLKSSKDNGGVVVQASSATWTASTTGSGNLRLSIGSYSLQKNNSGTQFGSYANTQTDIWIEPNGGSSTIDVTGVSLNKSEINLNVGDTETLVATVTPDNATNKDVIWVSDDDDIATVDDNGVVTGVAAGETTITVCTDDGEFEAYCDVTVASDTPIEEGTVFNFTSTAQDNFTDDNESGATVTTSGTTGYETDRGSAWNKSAGTITISSLPDGVITSITVDVSHNKTTSPVVAVSVGGTQFGDSYTVEKGSHFSAEFSVEGGVTAGNVVISIPETSDGTVWVKSITIEYDEGGSEDVVVTGVTIKENNVTVGETKTISSYEIGSSITFTATVSYDGEAGRNTVTWNSSNESVATVSNGVITLLSDGSTIITATSREDDNYSDTVVLNLSGGYAEHGTVLSDPLTCAEAAAKTNPTSGKRYYIRGVFVKFDSSSVNDFYISDSTSSSTTYEFYNHKNSSSYSASNFTVGCVVIMSVSSEKLPIPAHASYSDYVSGATIESVVKHSLTITTDPSTIYVGDIATLSAVCDKEDTGTLSFTSGATSVASISDGNKLLAKTANNVTISATSSCGGTGSKTLTINARTASILTSVQKYDDAEKFTLSITWNSNPSGTISYKWTSGTPTVASINETTGEIDVLKSGKTKIKCTVTVNDVTITTNECELEVLTTSPYINLSAQSATKYTGDSATVSVSYGNLTNGLWAVKTNDCISFTLTDHENGTATLVVSYLNAGSNSARVYFYDGEQEGTPTEGRLATFTANINASSVSIELDKESATIYHNKDSKKTVQINATVTKVGTYSTDVTWSSDNESIATVSSSGLVTAKAEGTAYIKCTSVSDTNVFKTCVVSVQTHNTQYYEKYTDVLKEGYYVICSDTTAMKNELTTSTTKRMAYSTVTVTNDKIEDPDETIVWHLTKETIDSVEYWTFYNEFAGIYMSFSGTDGAATTKTSKDDYCRFSFSDSREFVNKGKTNNNKNNLRYNSGIGFASYATGTGKTLTLYKLPSPEISVLSSSETNELVIGSFATLSVTKLNGATGTVNWSFTSTPTVAGDTPVVTLSSETGDEVVVTGNTHGTAVVTASLTGCEPVTQTFTVGRKLIGIEIYDSSSVQTEYTEGDSFDPTGLVIKNVYDNGDKEVTTDWDYDLKGSLLNSNTKVTISSTIDSSLTCELPITVAKNFNFDTQSQISLVDYKYEPSTHVDPITVTQNILSYFGENIPGSGDKVTSINLESGVTATASEAGNNGKVYSNGTEWRFYQADSGTLTLSAPEGKTISSFKLTYKVSDSGIPLYNGETFASGDSVSVNKEENCVISIGSTSGTKGKVSITDIEVVLSGIDIPAEVTILRSASLRSYVHISKDTFEEAFENPSDWEFGFMICETGDLKDGMSFESSAAALDSDATPSEVALNAITTSKAKVNIYSGDELPLYDNSYYEFGLNLKLYTYQFDIDFTVVWFAHNTKTGEYVFATASSSSIYDEAVLTDTSTLDEGQKTVIDYIVERYGKA